MIKMTIYHGEEVQQRDLPCDFLSLRMSLYQMNLMRHPDEVSVRDVQAEFTSTDPIGQKLISLIRPGDMVYMTGGSFGFLMLRHLPQDLKCTLVVNNADLAARLRPFTNIDVFVAGGRVGKVVLRAFCHGDGH